MTPFVPNTLPIQIEWETIIEDIAKASDSMGRFDGILEAMVNPNIFLSPLTRNEAVLSSKIEGTRASFTEVLQHEAGERFEEDKNTDIDEIINYRKALIMGSDYMRERNISLSLMRELHAVLMDNVRGDDKDPGAFRREQNWIGPPNTPIERARFVPPNPIVMKESLDNLEEYINSDNTLPLVQLAIIHAQFEIIHPFLDGNGRLGRMLIPLYLYQRKVLKEPAFYLSEYLDKHDEEYRDRLLAVTAEGDWHGWISFFLRAVHVQAKENTEKVRSILNLYERMKTDFFQVTRSKFALPALDTLFASPLINSTDFHRYTGIQNRMTSNKLLTTLKNQGLILTLKEGRGSKPSVYAVPELINIIEGSEIFKKVNKKAKKTKAKQS